MARRSRIAAWAALLAVALHALSPLAAPLAAQPGLHDLCTSDPAAPQPAGDSKAGHCAFCVQPASIANPWLGLEVFSLGSLDQPSRADAPHDRSFYLAANSRAPPAGA